MTGPATPTTGLWEVPTELVTWSLTADSRRTVETLRLAGVMFGPISTVWHDGDQLRARIDFLGPQRRGAPDHQLVRLSCTLWENRRPLPQPEPQEAACRA